MIEIENLTFSYRRGREVLSGLSVGFATGRVHGLLGRNGIGKTTLLKTVCGLLIPQKGKAKIDGHNAAMRKPSMLRNLFIVPEEFDLPGVPFESFIKRTAPLYPTFSREILENCCRELGIDMRRRMDNGSMGERKRTYIAFALACNTPYLFMDEPTNALDIPSKSVFRRLLAAHAGEERTIVISTHQVADLEKLIDNVVILDERGLAFNATTEQTTSRLRFGLQRPGDAPLYSEENIAGRIAVCENTEGMDTTVDLSLLFNAVTHHRDRVNEIMNR